MRGYDKKDGTHVDPYRATNPNNTQKDTKETPIIKGLTGVSETTRNSTEVRDLKEYRIWYQKIQ